jgi:glycosyltransferase involved in cell wall biosynthesis
MRVLHLSTQDIHGGAFRGAYWLHQALRQHSVDSQMLVARKYTQDPTVWLPSAEPISRVMNRWRKWRENQALKPYSNRVPGSDFSPAVVSSNLQRSIRRLNPNLMHLHWVVGGFVQPSDLPAWHRPLVWTMRDMWPFTGGCHYNQACDRYQEQCGCCPQLASQVESDISHALWQRKKQNWGKVTIHFVAISTWLADCARASSLCVEHPVQVIPNAIDPQLFTPNPKGAARRQFNLPSDKKIILYGAMHVEDERKGYSHFAEALHYLAGQQGYPDMHIVTFGAGEPAKVRATSLPTTHLGYISDNSKLAALYSAADVMVVPSPQEAFGKTAAEALACGTPVVCFDATGLKDVVEHQQCGYRAVPFSSEDLADGIAWVLADDERHAALARRGRAKVIEEFSLDRVAQQYKALYSEILQERQLVRAG